MRGAEIRGSPCRGARSRWRTEGVLPLSLGGAREGCCHAQHDEDQGSAPHPPTVRPATARDKRAPGSMSYPTKLLPKTVLHFDAPCVRKKRGPGVATASLPAMTKPRAKMRRDHVDGLFRSMRAGGTRCVFQKLYSAVAFGSPLLTSAEYPITLSRPIVEFKGNVQNLTPSDRPNVVTHRGVAHGRCSTFRVACPRCD